MLNISPNWALEIIAFLAVLSMAFFVALVIYKFGYENGYSKRNDDFEQSFDFENKNHEQLK